MGTFEKAFILDLIASAPAGRFPLVLPLFLKQNNTQDMWLQFQSFGSLIIYLSLLLTARGKND